jgi:hypothetical protein
VEEGDLLEAVDETVAPPGLRPRWYVGAFLAAAVVASGLYVVQATRDLSNTDRSAIESCRRHIVDRFSEQVAFGDDAIDRIDGRVIVTADDPRWRCELSSRSADADGWRLVDLQTPDLPTG